MIGYINNCFNEQQLLSEIYVNIKNVHFHPTSDANLEEMSSSQPLVEKATFNWCNNPGLPHWDNPIKDKLVRTTMRTQLHHIFKGNRNNEYRKGV